MYIKEIKIYSNVFTNVFCCDILFIGEIGMKDYYKALNEVIEEIENRLTEKIDYRKLAKIVATSDYTLQRIFCFLTDMTLTEYIRKRRLSNAAEDLLRGEEKIIDIALKYQYDSPISFARAFKKLHNVAPSEVKKNKISLKAVPKMEFKRLEEYSIELEYRIINLPEQVFYGKTTGVIGAKDKKTIADLWKKCKEDGTLNYIIKNQEGMEKYYGACQETYEDNINLSERKLKYYILGRKNNRDFTKLIIPKATWACFKLNSKEQKDILKLFDAIYMKWLPSSKYSEILSYPNLEIYYDNYCEICIAVK